MNDTDEQYIETQQPESLIDGALTAVRTAWTITDPAELTVDQRRTLATFPGWGALAPAFATTPKGRWLAIADELEALLPERAFIAAADQVDTSFYTPAAVTGAVWDIVTALGFRHGRILEPGVGAGAFLNTTPAGIDADWTGIDLDPTAIRISRLLNPAANLIESPLERTTLVTGSFDLAIGNVPFASTAPHDLAFNAGSLHEYFLLRAADAVRVGGFIVAVTSRSTMDGYYGLTRLLGKDAPAPVQLRAAVRMPSGIFPTTSVVTDLLVFERGTAAELAGTGGEIWDDAHENAPRSEKQPYGYGRYTVSVRPKITEPAVQGKPGIPVEVNRYWEAHPERVAGTMAVTTWQQNPLVVLSEDPEAAVRAAVEDAIESLPVYVDADTRSPLDLSDVELTSPEGFKTLSYQIVGNEIMQAMGASMKSVRNNAELRVLIELRDAACALIEAESNYDTPDTALTPLRERALELYGAYVKKFGALNRGTLTEGKEDPETGQPTFTWRRPTMGGFRNDPDYPLVMALEVFDQEQGIHAPAPILSRRVNLHPKPVDHVDTPAEALAVVMGESGRIDLNRIAGLLSLASEADARAALGDLAFDIDGQLVPARDALSGNVRVKLAAARAQAAGGDELDARYAAALEAVIPADLGALEIKVSLGASWITAEDVRAFAGEVLGVNNNIEHTPAVAVWEVVDAKSARGRADADLAYSTSRMNSATLLELALNNQQPIVYDEAWGRGGTKTRTRNIPESLAAAEKQSAINDRFSTWIWEDEDRAERVAAEYNRRFNSHRVRRADGSGLVFPGLSATVTPWAHQRDAVDRMVSTDRVLLGHPVGAGKTLELVLGAMTLRRFGLANKPMIVVPNHLLDQIVREAQQAYPTGKFLIAGRDDLTADRRRIFAARAATGDWDAIVITHQAFGSIPVSEDAELRWIEEQKATLRALLQFMPTGWGADKRKGPKAIARSIRSLEARIAKLRENKADPNEIRFEQLGADYLMVDECFPWHTPVLTDRGELPIGQIVDDALDVKIASVNVATGELEYKPIHRWVRKDAPDDLIRIRHEQGIIVCTRNHPIWVEGAGYVAAESIRNGDRLRFLRQDVRRRPEGQVLFSNAPSPRLPASTVWASPLPELRYAVHPAVGSIDGVQSQMRGEAQRFATASSTAALPAMPRGVRGASGAAEVLQPQLCEGFGAREGTGENRGIAAEELRVLRGAILSSVFKKQVLHRVLPDQTVDLTAIPVSKVSAMPSRLCPDTPPANFLLSALRDALPIVGKCRTYSRTEHAGCEHAETSGAGGARGVEPSNEGAQPDARPGREGEGEVFNDGAHVLVSRWERGVDGAAVTSGGAVGPANGVLYSDSRGMGSVRVAAELVRGGSGVSGGEAGDRSGWEVASAASLEVPGSPEDGGLGISRVVGVEILERRGAVRHGEGHADHQVGDGAVYNLEVAENHNYIADGVLVSNCHLFRRLDTGSTSRDNGFGSGVSKRATDLLLKIDMLAETKPGKPVAALFTGTPWSNTLAETWVWQRYLQPEDLRDAGVLSFDAWVATFVQYETAIEVSPDGSGFRMYRRPVGMKNLPELKTMLGQHADIIDADRIGLERPDHTVSVHISQPGAAQQRYFKNLAVRADRIRGGGKAEREDGGEGEDSMLLVCNDGRKVALDPRLVGIDEESAKVTTAADTIASVYHQNADRTYGSGAQPGAFQLVLLDLGTPHPGDAQVYGRLRARLIERGIPAARIRFVHEAKTDKARAALFAQCRDGDVSVLLGSTSKVGIGTNVQTRLVALHHVDAPWLPAEVTQREGRALRPGNLNPAVEIHRYVTEGSFDAYSWQALERKSRSFERLYDADDTIREIEDVGSTTLSYGEIKALAAGNPLLLDQAKANAEVQRLRLMRSVHLQGVKKAERSAKDLRAAATNADKRADQLDELSIAAATAPTDQQAVIDFLAGDQKNTYGRCVYRGLTVRRARDAYTEKKQPGEVYNFDRDWRNVSDIHVAQKVIRRGPAAVAAVLTAHADHVIDTAPETSLRLRAAAVRRRDEAAAAQAAADGAVFDREEALAAAVAKLARIEAEIAAEAERDNVGLAA